MKDKDIKHLEWVYERMKYVHNEKENYDYMIKFREILEALRQPPVSGQSEQFCSCPFVMIIRNSETDVAYCAECGKEVNEQNYL